MEESTINTEYTEAGQTPEEETAADTGVDCDMRVNVNQNFHGNGPIIQKTGCALCCGVDVASFVNGKKYTIADFSGCYDIITLDNNSQTVFYHWTGPDGFSFKPDISLAKQTEAETIRSIRNYVNNGIPVACHAVGNNKEHWFVAYNAADGGGNTWSTANILVLDPYNPNEYSEIGRRVQIYDAMSTSSVTRGIDRIRVPNM